MCSGGISKCLVLLVEVRIYWTYNVKEIFHSVLNFINYNDSPRQEAACSTHVSTTNMNYSQLVLNTLRKTLEKMYKGLKIIKFNEVKIN